MEHQACASLAVMPTMNAVMNAIVPQSSCPTADATVILPLVGIQMFPILWFVVCVPCYAVTANVISTSKQHPTNAPPPGHHLDSTWSELFVRARVPQHTWLTSSAEFISNRQGTTCLKAYLQRCRLVTSTCCSSHLTIAHNRPV